ncbi:hypothetical protein [Acidihalobacter prosperus]
MTTHMDSQVWSEPRLAELTVQDSEGTQELVVLMCQGVPVGFCLIQERLVLALDLDDLDDLRQGVLKMWSHELVKTLASPSIEYMERATLEEEIYDCLSSMGRPRQFSFGADICPTDLVEVEFRNGCRLLFNDTDLLAATIEGKNVYMSTVVPMRTRKRVVGWVKAQRNHTVHFEPQPLSGLVDRHIA